MSKIVLLAVFIGSLCFCSGAIADPQLLSDDELAQITAGDVFPNFPDGPFVYSLIETTNSYTFQIETTAPLNQPFSSTQVENGNTQTVFVYDGTSSQTNTVSQTWSW